MRTEPRWPVALTILAVLALLLLLPNRVRLFPTWLLCLLGAAVLVSLAAAATRPGRAWLRFERWASFGFVAILAAGNLTVLRELIVDMIRRQQLIDGLHLLASSIAVWAVNIMMFSIFYWQLDRGGPIGRAGSHGRPDWIFPQEQVPSENLPTGWRPEFIDYLFLGFSTATAFSTTDTLPITGRAKFAMMSEGTISLVTLVVVAARAIGLLGS